MGTGLLWLAIILPLPALHAQLGTDLQHLGHASTAGDEVVLGVDRDHLVIRVHAGTAPMDWSGAEMRMARLTTAPWEVEVPEAWGLVPWTDAGWQGVGQVVHVAIDAEAEMAVVSAVQEGRAGIWLAGSHREGVHGAWGKPWPVPALSSFSGQCAFAVFDEHPGREGDLLVALRPDMAGGGELFTPESGRWRGGYDIARIRRDGGYRSVVLLDSINSPADEMALVPGPDGGGWLSTERLGGSGGLDPWWCPRVPDGADEPGPATRLEGHRLIVRCGSKLLTGLKWQVRDAQGSPLMRLVTDDAGWADLSELKVGQRYSFSLMGDPPGGCLEGVAQWEDDEGRVIRRFILSGARWDLSFLSALPLDGWGWRGPDRSGLPPVDASKAPGQVHHTGSHDLESRTAVVPANGTPSLVGDSAHWVVFHAVGQKGISRDDRDALRTLAHALKARPEEVVLIVGHASPDGNPEANVRLASERARHVAAQLEFAGLPASQIRFEGVGASVPMTGCPPGVHCPEGTLARSRRTELHLRSSARPVGGPMQ